jgi:UDP:flavonoid glycosyltransferase YjiC (YdhE family)
VEINPNDLILPTIRAMGGRDDVLVVAILGWKDASLTGFLQEGETLPKNARVADYLSYDAVLEHASLWVHNGGFGACSHGIVHGVPMVVAGEGMDKTENARRVAWSGVGVDLGTGRPGVEMVRRAIDTVLGDRGFEERVRGLKRESDGLGCVEMVHVELMRMADSC